MKTIKVHGYEVSYDIKNLVERARQISYDEIRNQKKGECGDEYNTTRIEFEIEINKFIDEINKLDENIVELVSKNAVFTKAKKLHKGRNHKLIESGLYLNYGNEYGSHSYEVPHIVLVETTPNKATLVLSNIKEQSSF